MHRLRSIRSLGVWARCLVEGGGGAEAEGGVRGARRRCQVGVLQPDLDPPPPPIFLRPPPPPQPLPYMTESYSHLYLTCSRALPTCSPPPPPPTHTPTETCGPARREGASTRCKYQQKKLFPFTNCFTCITSLS